MLLEPRPLDVPAPAATRGWPVVLLGCLALAALSLLLPSAPTYDPWAWIIWGREITQLDLVTTTGPSWKPLPVLFTIPFSLFGDAAPALWLVVARAGGLLGIVFAFLVARRLGGLVAGGAAAGALVLAPWLFKNTALGNSEGLMAAAVLGAVDRHLAGHRFHAFGLGLAAALLRPEAWPFFGLYGLWLAWHERGRALALVGAGFASLPVLWLGPELWGSGNLNRASDRAQDPNPNSPAFAEHPALKVVENAAEMISVPVAIGLVCVVAILVLRRPAAGGHGRVVAALAAMAVAWLAVVAYMTANGFSGNQRYLVMPVTLAVVVAAVGVGWVARSWGGLRGRVVVAAALVAIAFTVPYWSGTAPMLESMEYQGRLHDDLGRVVADAGGATSLRACGPVATGAFLVPAVAWHLRLHAQDVGLEPKRPGVVFRVRTNPISNPVPPLGSFALGPARELALRGDWRVLGACG